MRMEIEIVGMDEVHGMEWSMDVGHGIYAESKR